MICKKAKFSYEFLKNNNIVYILYNNYYKLNYKLQSFLCQIINYNK